MLNLFDAKFFGHYPVGRDVWGRTAAMVRMVKLAPEIATAMRTDTWLQKRVACAAQTTRALGIKMIVKRARSRSEALWYRDFGVEFAQSQPLSPGEPIGAQKDIDP